MEQIIFHSLENRNTTGITTFGSPWKIGQVKEDYTYELKDKDGCILRQQDRVTAYWQDGSVKWSAHTSNVNGNGPYTLTAYSPDERMNLVKEDTVAAITIEDKVETIMVDAGRLKVSFRKSGNHLLDGMWLDGQLISNSANLVYIKESHSQLGELEQSFHSNTKEEKVLYGEIEEITIEEEGSQQVVILVKGIHKADELTSLPYILRFYIGYDVPSMKITHTFIVDHNGENEFMKGLGISFDCKITGETYNRHVKILGEEGIFHEASALLMSWRPRIDEEIYDAQMSSKLLDDSVINENTRIALRDITLWNSYRVYQGSPKHYRITKGTGKVGCSFIESLHGKKASGIVGVSGEDGGLILGLRHFYEKYPSSLWVDGLTKDRTKLTAWFWSYEHEAMDFRHYDDKGHASAYYEGFDEVRSTPYGIACTNEVLVMPVAAGVVSDESIYEANDIINKPLVLVCEPEYYHQVTAFGPWSLKDNSSAMGAWLEEQLERFLAFYIDEIKQREWYGLFNYGDVMHTYDPTRHMWRYDMGGYAWQNTELVPTLWLWYSFLRTGREDVYTLAESMTRHCSEIDIYHMGEYKGLGSRHNVLHWGCSCKEPRIAMAGHHRFFYYMTGDHRMKDVFDDVVDADHATLSLDPLRFFYEKEDMVLETHARVGPDWSSYCSNWMTSWEQSGDRKYIDKLLVGLNDIKKSPYKMFSGSDYEYSPQTGHMRYIGENAGGGSHLALCMGAPQVWFEISDMIEDNEFKQMLADYGVFYFLSKEEKQKVAPLIQAKGFSYPYMAASMGAYGAHYYKDEVLAKKVLRILYEDLHRLTGDIGITPNEVEGYVNNSSLKELPWISTNFVAQWCLNTIVALELLKEYL